MKVKLTTTKDVFNLSAPDCTIAYKSIITYVAIIVRKAKVNFSISLAHQNVLLQSNAKYSPKRDVIKRLSIPKGMISHTEQFFLIQTPTHVVVRLIDSAGFNGV